MPWDVKAKDDSGSKFLRAVLSTGWLTNLYRDHMLNYHATITETLKRGKDKNKTRKIAEIKKLEELATSSAANTRKSKRLMLAMLLEEYFTLFSDQNILLGPRSLMILTLLAHASSEINWLVVHQNDPRITLKKRETESLRTGQETIMILYYLVRIRDLIKDNENIMKAYFVEALKQEGTKDINEMMEQLDLKREDISLVKKILENIQKIEIIENEDGMKINNSIHRYDLGRVITALSCQAEQSSSPMQMKPQLTRQIELICLHIQMLQDPTKIAKKKSNMNFLFFYEDTFNEYFNHLFASYPNCLSYSIAFPMICQDFTSSLNSLCHEEYEKLIKKTHDLANSFLLIMAKKTMEHIDLYCNEYNLLARDLLPVKTAEIFSEREQEYRRKIESSEKADQDEKTEKTDQEDMEAKKKRRKTMANRSVQRTNLFESKIEIVTIGMKELLKAFNTKNVIEIASYKVFPQAFFMEKLTDRMSERMKGLVVFPNLPSQINLSLSAYHGALLHLDPGLDISSLFRNMLYDLRANDEIVTHTYLNKYKDKLFTILESPHCYFNESLLCFMFLTPKMENKSDEIELLTCCDEMEALSQVFGAEGVSWLTAQIGENITASIAKLMAIVKDNSNLLTESHDKEDAWRQLANVPEFILTSIDIGKKLGLVQLLDQGHENVTKSRLEYLSGVIDMMIHSEMSNLLGVPDTIETIASGLGYNKVI